MTHILITSRQGNFRPMTQNYNVSFDKGGAAMRSRHCPVREYTKDKPMKFRVDFCIMVDNYIT